MITYEIATLKRKRPYRFKEEAEAKEAMEFMQATYRDPFYFQVWNGAKMISEKVFNSPRKES